MTTKNIFKEEKTVEVSVPDFGKPRKYVQHIVDSAEDLFELQMQIEKKDAAFEKKMKPLREKYETMREKQTKDMVEARMKHADVGNGQYVYVVMKKSRFEVTDEDAAMKFYKKEGLLRPDKTAANKKLLRMVKTPKGFQEVQSESLTLKATER